MEDVIPSAEPRCVTRRECGHRWRRERRLLLCEIAKLLRYDAFVRRSGTSSSAKAEARAGAPTNRGQHFRRRDHIAPQPRAPEAHESPERRTPPHTGVPERRQAGANTRGDITSWVSVSRSLRIIPVSSTKRGGRSRCSSGVPARASWVVPTSLRWFSRPATAF